MDTFCPSTERLLDLGVGPLMQPRRLSPWILPLNNTLTNHRQMRLAHSVALFAMYYNFVRIHKTLRTTPAMAAGVTSRLWEIGDIVDALEAWEGTQERAA